MYFKIFVPFVSLLALVSAAPTASTLHVSLSASAENTLMLVATVCNDGPGAVSVLKAGILYSHPSNIIQVVDAAGKALPFEGVRPILDAAGEGLWVSVPAGETLTNTIDLDTTFDFPVDGEYTVSASSYLQVQSNSEDGQYLVPYDVSTKIKVSSEVRVAQSSTFAANAKLEKREFAKRAPAYINPNCQGSQYSQVHQALWDAYGLAYLAATHVPWLEPTYWSFFKTSANSGFVQGKFNAIGNTAGTSTCTDPSCVITVSCVDTNNFCAGGAVAVSSGDVIYPCSSFWSYPASGTCANQAWGKADIFLHELSHSHQIGDIVYGLDGSRNLSPDQAKANADTYRYYARSTDSGCNW